MHFFEVWCKCLKSDCGNDRINLWVYKNPWIVYFKWASLYHMWIHKAAKNVNGLNSPIKNGFWHMDKSKIGSNNMLLTRNSLQMQYRLVESKRIEIDTQCKH